MHLLNDRPRISRYSSKNIDISTLLQNHIANNIYQKFYSEEKQSFNYVGFARSEALQTYRLMLDGLNQFDVTQLKTDNKKISFWLNIYNMLCIHLAIHLKITQRIDEQSGFFSQFGYVIGGRSFSLDDIEHGILRANSKGYSKLQKPFKSNDLRLALACNTIDPKIHFGLYCATISSPRLVFFEESQLQNQLKENAAKCIKQHMRFNFDKGVIYIPKIFKWYEQDFGNKNQIIEFIAEHANDETISSSLLTYKEKIKLEYVDFKWTLNKHN